MQRLTIARSKWSRRKLNLFPKVLYRLCLLLVACLIHAVIHVHNFIWHRSRQQGLPILAEPDGYTHEAKSPPASTDAGGLPIQHCFFSIQAALLHNQAKGFGS